jgi:hypothetical protein
MRACRAAVGEQGDQNGYGDGNHPALGRGGGHGEAFDGRKDGDGGGDDAVAVKQRRPEEGHQRNSIAFAAAPGLLVSGNKRKQGEDAALPVVVCAHDEGEVLHRDDQRQRPHHQREHPKDVGLGGLDAVFGEEAFSQRVERAGPNVAEDNAQGTQCKRGTTGTGDGFGLGAHARRQPFTPPSQCAPENW